MTVYIPIPSPLAVFRLLTRGIGLFKQTRLSERLLCVLRGDDDFQKAQIRPQY
jgi:hypothetical protein